MGGTVRALHAETIRDEDLGESSGVAGQRFQLSRRPVAVDDPMLQLDTSEGEGWQRWELVDTFAGSGPEDRHFQLDPVTGEITFGPALRQPDGGVRQYGAVPLKGVRIRATAYRIGGGRSGNVARGSLSVLRTSIPYVSSVENREAARGGVDGESVAEAKVRAPISLRAQDRAVTVRDYEELTRRAAPEAARRRCRTSAASCASSSWSRATNCSAGSPPTWTSAGRSAPGWPSARRTTRASPPR
jgi:predicted phage baseplate assembly protein